MYTIILASIVACILLITLKVLKVEEEICSSIFFLVLILGILLGCFFPISGYEELQLYKTEEIEQIDEEHYIIEEGWNYKYAQAYIPKVIDLGKDYLYSKKLMSIPKNCAKINTGFEPMLKIYKQNAKKTKWTFAIWCDRYEYIFIIPKNKT